MPQIEDDKITNVLHVHVRQLEPFSILYDCNGDKTNGSGIELLFLKAITDKIHVQFNYSELIDSDASERHMDLSVER